MSSAAVPRSKPPGERPSFRRGLWRLADPKISLASMAGMFLGAAAAARGGALSPAWLALTVAGIFAIEVAKNASGEIFDFDSGTDLAVAPEERTPFSGGKRVLVDGLLTRSQTKGIAWAGYALGAAAGIAIAFFREPAALAFGAAGVALAFFYHAPPARLSYRGWGEAAVAIVYGPLIVLGTETVQRGRPSALALLASIPLGLMIGAFLWVNEIPDRRADASAGKRTLVVRLGPKRAAASYAGIVAAAFLLQAILPWAARAPGAALGMLALPPAVAAALLLDRGRAGTGRIASAQALTLVSFLILAVAGGIGLAVV
ncbi:MAG TPA: prenyltransferase [Thermoanaerobaculia bacterium]|nr:prenyltransferase [Thermoanaerobaculia bacterium]